MENWRNGLSFSERLNAINKMHVGLILRLTFSKLCPNICQNRKIAYQNINEALSPREALIQAREVEANFYDNASSPVCPVGIA